MAASQTLQSPRQSILNQFRHVYARFKIRVPVLDLESSLPQ